MYIFPISIYDTRRGGERGAEDEASLPSSSPSPATGRKGRLFYSPSGTNYNPAVYLVFFRRLDPGLSPGKGVFSSPSPTNYNNLI